MYMYRYSAQAFLEIYYPGTSQRMTHTITHVGVRSTEDTFFMHGCDRDGEVLMHLLLMRIGLFCHMNRALLMHE